MGGYSAFLAYGLLLGDENFLYFFEFWVACYCFVEVIWCAHKQKESSLTILTALLLACLLCTQPILNASSTVSSAALYLAALYLGFTHPKSQTDLNPLCNLGFNSCGPSRREVGNLPELCF